MSDRRKQVVLLGTVVLLAASVRLALMYFRGSFLEYDETYYLILAKNLLNGRGYVLNGLPHVNNLPLFSIATALFSLITRDLVWASRVVTVVSGGLVLVPVYCLVKQMSGERTALATALLVSLTPSLLSFANFSTRYVERIYFGSEHLFMLLVWCGIYYAWTSHRTLSPGRHVVSGAFLGLALLARVEGILYFGGVLAFLLLSSVTAPSAMRRRRIAGIAALIAAVAVVGSPLAVYHYRTTGRLGLSGKVNAKSGGLARGAGYVLLKHNDTMEFCRQLYRLDPSGKAMQNPLWGVDDVRTSPERQNGAATGLRSALAMTPFNIRFFLVEALAIVLPLFLWPFCLAGIYAEARERHARRRNVFFALAAVLPTLTMVAFVLPLPKYCLVLVPVFSWYAARGVALAGRMIARKGAGKAEAAMDAALVICLALVSLAPVSTMILDKARPLPHLTAGANRDMGLEMKEYTAADRTVMSWHPALAFFAERDWRVLPMASLDEILRYAMFRKTDYIVFSRFDGPNPPLIRGILARESRYDFLVMDLTDTGGAPSGYQIEREGTNYAVLKPGS